MAKTNREIFREIKKKQDELVLACTNIAIIAAPFGTQYNPELVDTETGMLKPLPEGFVSVGEIEKQAGVDLSPDMKTEGVMGYGSTAPRRVFLTEENFDIDMTLQEVTELAARLFFGFEEEDIEHGKFATKMTKRAAANLKYWTFFLIGFDENPNGELFVVWELPKVALTKKGKTSLNMSKEMSYPITLSVQEHNNVQYAMTMGGPAWPELCAKAGFVNDKLPITRTLVMPKNISGGTWSLTVGAHTFADLAWNISASALKNKITGEGLSDIEVKGSNTEGYTITVTGAKKLTADGSGLTGGESTIITVNP